MSFTMLMFVAGQDSIAEDAGRGGDAGAFTRIPIDARHAALGGGGAALADDGYALVNNPAGLVWLEQREVTLSHASLDLDRQLNYIGFAVPLNGAVNHPSGKKNPLRAGFALGWLRAGVTDIDGRDFNGLHTQMYSAQEHAFLFAFAISPFPRFSVGIGSRVYYSRMPGILPDEGAFTATGVGFGLGMLFRIREGWTAGAALRDLDANYTWDSQPIYERGTQTVNHFPQTGSLGLTARILNNLNTHFHAYKIEYRPWTLRAGLEWTIIEGAMVRAGWDRNQPTLGVGFQYALNRLSVALHYAYVPEPVSIRSMHLFTWKVNF